MRPGFASLVACLGLVACRHPPPPADPLAAALADGTYKRVTSVMAVQGDRVLVERYAGGADAETLHDPRSEAGTPTAPSRRSTPRPSPTCATWRPSPTTSRPRPPSRSVT
jgi:hypothetical protein